MHLMIDDRPRREFIKRLAAAESKKRNSLDLGNHKGFTSTR
jgi:hypothetical protein